MMTCDLIIISIEDLNKTVEVLRLKDNKLVKACHQLKLSGLKLRELRITEYLLALSHQEDETKPHHNLSLVPQVCVIDILMNLNMKNS